MPSCALQVNLWVLLHSILSNKVSKGKDILAGMDLQVSHAARYGYAWLEGGHWLDEETATVNGTESPSPSDRISRGRSGSGASASSLDLACLMSSLGSGLPDAVPGLTCPMGPWGSGLPDPVPGSGLPDGSLGVWPARWAPWESGLPDGSLGVWPARCGPWGLACLMRSPVCLPIWSLVWPARFGPRFPHARRRVTPGGALAAVTAGTGTSPSLLDAPGAARLTQQRRY